MSSQQHALFYIGTQGHGPGEGIFAAQLDEATGRVTGLGLAATIARPTWLLRDPGRPILYAVSELGNKGECEGEIVRFRIAGPGGKLELADRVSSGGGGPTHLAIDPGGRAVFVANFGGGETGVLPVAADGSLEGPVALRRHSGSGPHRRQTGPHPHGVTLDPSGRFVLSPDMGADRLFVHPYDAAGQSFGAPASTSVELPDGCGPRLILFGHDGRFAYLLSELSAELFVFAWDHGQGRLAQIACAPLDDPGTEGEPSAAALTLSADGRFLYASNRRTNAIQTFAIDATTGLLSEVQRIDSGGSKPWSAAVSPGGAWLLVTNQGSGMVQLFRIDRETGALAPGDRLAVPVPTSTAFA